MPNQTLNVKILGAIQMIAQDEERDLSYSVSHIIEKSTMFSPKIDKILVTIELTRSE